MPLTRLAPSPTGALHLGNARTFLANWILARQNCWRILLRIEDLDGPRVKAGADRAAISDLQWLGLDWDEGPVYQSQRHDVYRKAIDHLLEIGAAYPCVCSRREVDLAASAPHPEDGALVYPGTCRGKYKSIEEARTQTGKSPAVRFAAPDQVVQFVDQFAGPQVCNVAQHLGDFVIAKSDGSAAYQLAVVIDDLEAGVTDIVRGDDLVDSTFRQILLYHALGGMSRIPRYTHLPLVVGPDGRRLAKRHGDTRLAMYREAGVSAQRVRDLLARWCGLDISQNLLSDFRLDNLPQKPIIFTQADDAFLRT